MIYTLKYVGRVTTQTPVPIPDFTSVNESIGISILKAKAENSRPLGIVKSGPEELIAVYDGMSCLKDRQFSCLSSVQSLDVM